MKHKKNVRRSYISKDLVINKVQKLEEELKKANNYIKNYKTKINDLEQLCMRIKGALIVLKDLLNESSS